MHQLRKPISARLHQGSFLGCKIAQKNQLSFFFLATEPISVRMSIDCSPAELEFILNRPKGVLERTMVSVGSELKIHNKIQVNIRSQFSYCCLGRMILFDETILSCQLVGKAIKL